MTALPFRKTIFLRSKISSLKRKLCPFCGNRFDLVFAEYAEFFKFTTRVSVNRQLLLLHLIILDVFAFLCFQGGPELTGIPLLDGRILPIDNFLGFLLGVNNPLLLDRRLPRKPEITLVSRSPSSSAASLVPTQARSQRRSNRSSPRVTRLMPCRASSTTTARW